ncbi:MAG: hypothetical protein CVV41_19860 [Candidatus Riflebacteria bacterium HGW-Riflebacteria-1]|jgi:hypothetical protein|nr:MAG: hypothetical protein CVV41_19860 [Candidatus Riflebacteria bacterium HGW-Riflebacteria-1]
MKLTNDRRAGLAGLVLVIFIIIGLVGIYFGNQWFSQKYYIRLFDGDVIRYLDIPPYAERLTSADQELLGVCDINVATSKDQVNNFFNSTCNRYGYLCKTVDGGIVIELRRNYTIKGEYNSNTLQLRWTPVLPEKLKAKAAALTKTDK